MRYLGWRADWGRRMLQSRWEAGSDRRSSWWINRWYRGHIFPHWAEEAIPVAFVAPRWELPHTHPSWEEASMPSASESTQPNSKRPDRAKRWKIGVVWCLHSSGLSWLASGRGRGIGMWVRWRNRRLGRRVGTDDGEEGDDILEELAVIKLSNTLEQDPWIVQVFLEGGSVLVSCLAHCEIIRKIY